MVFLAYLAVAAALLWLGFNSARNRFAAVVCALVLKPAGIAFASLLVTSVVSIPLALVNGGRPLVGLAMPAFVVGAIAGFVSGLLWVVGGMDGFVGNQSAVPPPDSCDKSKKAGAS